MPTTSPYAFPYPSGSSATNVTGDIQALAEAIDNFIEANVTRRTTGTAAARPAASAPLAGMMYRATDTGAFSYCDGSAWYPWPSLAGFLTTAGGTMTGDIDLAGHQLLGALLTEDKSKITTVGAAGANRNLDAQVSPFHDITLDQNVTFTFAGADGDQLTLILRQPAVPFTVGWPATIDWAGQIAPRQAGSSSVVYRFLRVNARWAALPFMATDALFARKTADETVNNNATLQNDDHLVLPVAANAIYDVKLIGIWSSSGAADLKVAFTMPAGATFRGVAAGGGGVADIFVNPPFTFIDNAAVSMAHESSTEKTSLLIQGLLRMGGTSGNFQFQWAQAAAVVQDTKFYIDSYITARLVG